MTNWVNVRLLLSFSVENEAFEEMMDVAEQHGQAARLKWLTRSHAAPPPTRPRRGGR